MSRGCGILIGLLPLTYALQSAQSFKLRPFFPKAAFLRVPMMGFEPIPRFRENGF